MIAWLCDKMVEKVQIFENFSFIFQEVTNLWNFLKKKIPVAITYARQAENYVLTNKMRKNVKIFKRIVHSNNLNNFLKIVWSNSQPITRFAFKTMYSYENIWKIKNFKPKLSKSKPTIYSIKRLKICEWGLVPTRLKRKLHICLAYR